MTAAIAAEASATTKEIMIDVPSKIISLEAAEVATERTIIDAIRHGTVTNAATIATNGMRASPKSGNHIGPATTQSMGKCASTPPRSKSVVFHASREATMTAASLLWGLRPATARTHLLAMTKIRITVEHASSAIRTSLREATMTAAAPGTVTDTTIKESLTSQGTLTSLKERSTS